MLTLLLRESRWQGRLLRRGLGDGVRLAKAMADVVLRVTRCIRETFDFDRSSPQTDFD